MLITTQGIVLNTLRHGESSIIARIYTMQSGVLSILVKGAKSRKKNAVHALLEPLSIIELTMRLKQSTTLHIPKEIRLSYGFTSIPFSPIKRAQALFLAELISKTIKEEEKNLPLFEFLIRCIHEMDTLDTENPDFHLYMMMAFSRYLGISPIFAEDSPPYYFDVVDGVFVSTKKDTTLDLEKSLLIVRLLKESGQYTICQNRSERKQILMILLDYYRWHLPGFQTLRSPEILESLFDS